MKLLISLMLICLISSASIAQEQKKQKLTRQERKELKAQRQAEQIKLITATIESKKFVLEADQIKDRRGKLYPVNSNINFVAVDSNRAAFQLGSAHTIGINGVGGVTIDGQISRFTIDKREKSGSYFITITISATGGFYDVSLNVSSTGNASAQVMTLRGQRIEYSGKIVPLSLSRVHKGFSY